MTDSIERYEALASAFYDETGVMPPGKDVSAAMGGYDVDELRAKLWRLWLKQNTPVAPGAVTEAMVEAAAEHHLSVIGEDRASYGADSWEVLCREIRDLITAALTAPRADAAAREESAEWADKAATYHDAWRSSEREVATMRETVAAARRFALFYELADDRTGNEIVASANALLDAVRALDGGEG